MKNVLLSAIAAATLLACGGSTPPAACPNPPNGAHDCAHCKDGGCPHCKDGEPCEHCKNAGHEHGANGEHGPGHEHGANGEHGHEHGSELSPELRAFHGVIAPIWHTEAGPARVAKACDGAKALADSAKATGDAELIAGAANVSNACAKDGRAEVEPTLTIVHERFHALMKASK